MLRSLSATVLAFAMLPQSIACTMDASAEKGGTSEAAIRDVVAEQVVAWNAGDGTRYASRVAPDVSFTNLFGMVMYGAPAFAKRHNEMST
jgi:hypothetical protein